MIEKRLNHEPPAVTAMLGWRYHHIGIPNTQPRAQDHHVAHLGVYVSGFETSHYGIEWIRFEPHCRVPEIVRTVAHIAFAVDDLDEALKGREILIAPTEPSVGVRVAFILDDGAPVELLQFDTARAVRPKTRLPNNALHLTTARAQKKCASQVSANVRRTHPRRLTRHAVDGADDIESAAADASRSADRRRKIWGQDNHGLGRRLALCPWAVLAMNVAAPLAPLAPDDLKSFDGTWEGQLHVYRLSVTDGASQLSGQSEEGRLQIRRVPFELKTKNARGEWEDHNSSTLFSLHKFEAAAGTLLGHFLRSGADKDGRWVEHQTFYITRKDCSTVVVYWLRAVNNLDLGLTNPDSKFGFLRARELHETP